LVEALLVASLVSPFVTSALNGDVISAGARTLPGVGRYDALSAVVAELLLLLPFFLGRQFLRSSADNREVLRTLIIAGLLYSPLVLFEIRMSPQLHYWVYGYYPSQFLQQMREGGFRATVFMGHGLAVSFFLMSTVIAAATFWRGGIKIKNFSPLGVTAYLFGVLFLNKSLASTIYAIVLAPLARFASSRLQVRLAIALVLLALLYPAARIVDVFPTKTLIETAAWIDPERAASLQFRFDNEDRLLHRASERLLFGWGRFGRSRVYGEYGDTTVTDGRWIITLGQFGLIGFILEFGLLALSVISAAIALKFARTETEGLLLAGLALIVAVSVVNLLPNSGLTPWTWLLAGALVGRAEALRAATVPGELSSAKSRDSGLSRKNEAKV
jgi:hypothetical protein